MSLIVVTCNVKSKTLAILCLLTAWDKLNQSDEQKVNKMIMKIETHLLFLPSIIKLALGRADTMLLNIHHTFV